MLDKAEAHAAAKKIDPAVLAAARLAPGHVPARPPAADRLRLCQGRDGAPRRRSRCRPGATTRRRFAEFKARIAKTSHYVQGFKPAQIDGSEDARDRPEDARRDHGTFKGQAYLLHFVLPNFFFHAATAYDILRHNGVELGKRDFLGQVPGMNA